MLGFVSQPVQYRFAEPFDDGSDRQLRLPMARLERRSVLDARFAGAAAGCDGDLETMGQFGSVVVKDIRASG